MNYVIEREQQTVQGYRDVYVLLTDGATYRRYRALGVPVETGAAQYVAGLNRAAMWNDGSEVPTSELIGTAAYIALQPIPFVYQTSKPVISKEIAAEWQQNPVRNWLSLTL